MDFGGLTGGERTMRVSRSNVCGNNEPFWKVKEMGKKSFMEWQNFCGVIPAAGSILVFQDAVQGVVASLVCAENDTKG
jgi:hypothetical protein